MARLLAGSLILCLLPSASAQISVTFKVDMSGKDVAAAGVHLAGSFQGWDPSATQLLDEDADGVYEITLDLSADEHEFKFINGDTWDGAEAVPVSCGESDSGHANRILVLAANSTEAVVQECFAGCGACREAPACSLYSCPQGYALKEDHENLAGNTLEACCELTAPAEVPCSLMHCPSGYAMRSDMLHESGADVMSCCEQTVAGWADIVVRSAGFSDGNEASFRIDGHLVYDTSRRGLTVLVLRPDLAVKSVKTFDTFGSEADALASYLNDLPQDTLVLIGASDEASNGLNLAVRNAIKGCGGTQIDALGFRSSYALVGVKGGSALAEAVKASSEGFAVATAQAQIVEPSLPAASCDARVAQPPVSGYLAEANLYLDAGCHYKVYESDSAGQCLQGSWIVLGGTSNMLLYFNTLVKLLAPDEAIVKRGGEKGLWGNENVIDVFIQNGQIVYWKSFGGWDSSPMCRQINKDAFADNEAACRAELTANLSTANLSVPVDPRNTTRVTMFLAFFWHRVNMAVELVEANSEWASADVSFVAQVVAWYRICNVAKWSYCPRKELFDLSFEAALQLFDGEMDSALVALERVCTPQGRAGRLGCVVGTNTWSEQGVNPTSSYSRLNDRIRHAMATRSTATLRHVDFYDLGSAMTHEVSNGHGSQVLNLWSWQVMLNGMCPSNLAPEGSWAVFDGTICSATEASMDLCPDYVQMCGDWCELWYCMNSVPCSMTPTLFNSSSDGAATSTSAAATPQSTLAATVTSSTTTEPANNWRELAVTYSFGADGANACPESAVSASEAECKVMALAFGGSAQEPALVDSADDPKGCFDYQGSVFYNGHSAGSGRPGCALYCRRTRAAAADGCPTATTTTTTTATSSAAAWTYVISEVASNECPDGTAPLTAQECQEVETKSEGALRDLKQISTAADPKGCFKFGYWSLYFNAHSTGAIREGRYPICRPSPLV